MKNKLANALKAPPEEQHRSSLRTDLLKVQADCRSTIALSFVFAFNFLMVFF
jgi:hypothetical protein